MPDEMLTLNFSGITMADLARVGGKNASLGELYRSLQPAGVGVLDGFATTAEAYRRLLAPNGLGDRLRAIFRDLDPENLQMLERAGEAARQAVLTTPLPAELCQAIESAYDALVTRCGRAPALAVRSSAISRRTSTRRSSAVASSSPRKRIR